MIQVLEFPHSHFCEKVRWALDAKGLPYERTALFPGWHIRVVRKIAPKTTVPVLVDQDQVVQDSSAIISYLDRRYPDRPLTIAGHEAELLAFEKTVDGDLGVNIRRILYHHLLHDRAGVRFYFMHNSPWWQRLLFTLVYPLIASRIRAKYRIDDAGVAASTAAFEVALDRLDAQVKQGPYLFGNRFSRADIAVASLLCFLCMPAEHPVPWKPVTNPAVQAILTKHADRPVTRWVLDVYRRHRAPVVKS